MGAEQRRGESQSFVELPAPTAWPMVAALGVTMCFAGLVMQVMVTIAGAVLVVAGAVGWFREVLPVEHEEPIPLRRPSERAKPVQPALTEVRRLMPGKDQHRLRLPVEIHPYSAGVWGGLAGGVAMAALAMGYGAVAHGSIWYPINLLAAVAMPGLAEAGPEKLASLNIMALSVAVVVHAIVSVFVGLVYAAILPTVPRHPALWGGIVAPALWTGLLHSCLGLINPVLKDSINWIWFVASQMAFGFAAGWVIARTERIKTLQHLPLATRLGVEATGMHADQGEKR